MTRTAWMRDPALLAVNALAAYRLTRLWTKDSLPPLPMLRERITDWAEHNWAPNVAAREHLAGHRSMTPEEVGRLDDARRWAGDKPPLVNLVDCPWCAGFWVSAGVVALATAFPRAWTPLATALAFSAVAGAASTALAE